MISDSSELNSVAAMLVYRSCTPTWRFQKGGGGYSTGIWVGRFMRSKGQKRRRFAGTTLFKTRKCEIVYSVYSRQRTLKMIPWLSERPYIGYTSLSPRTQQTDSPIFLGGEKSDWSVRFLPTGSGSEISDRHPLNIEFIVKSPLVLGLRTPQIYLGKVCDIMAFNHITQTLRFCS